MRLESPVAKFFMVAALLSGCGGMPVADSPKTATSPKPVMCVGKLQCDIYWQRAQAWVANNSGYRLQTVTDTIIETQGPTVARTALAFRVTKVPDDKDGARIFVVASCGNALGCSPSSSDAVNAFARFLTN